MAILQWDIHRGGCVFIYSVSTKMKPGLKNRYDEMVNVTLNITQFLGQIAGIT